MRLRTLAVLGILGLGVASAPFHVEAKPADNAALQNFSDASLVGNGAHTSLQRDGDSVHVGVHSRNLTPGHAYTVWLVIFNTPEGCVDGCGEDDLMRPEATNSVIWSGVGGVANNGGNLNGRGTLTEENPQGYQQLFTDLGAPDPGFLDAQGAEIHTVVRDHGPATGNPAQTTTFEGDCTPGSSFGLGGGAYECVDVQFSIHFP
jgi:hypothetical protein